jgi:hypothetical protein
LIERQLNPPYYLQTERSAQMMEYLSFSHGMRRGALQLAIVSFALLIMVPLAACGGGASSGTSGTSSGPVNLALPGL